MSAREPKRFYEKAEAGPAENDGYGVFLDGRPARTARRRLLVARAQPLAAAVAAEWAAQSEHVDRASMPLTALLSAAIDGGEAAAPGWAEDVLDYLGSDLVCYRAAEPDALVLRQGEVWDPFLDWFKTAYGERLVTVTGVIAAPQPRGALDAVRRDLAATSPEALFALRTATAIAGSAVLALALSKEAFSADAVFAASRLDERFQAERWGEDAEAKDRERTIEAEFAAVARFIRLAGKR